MKLGEFAKKSHDFLNERIKKINEDWYKDEKSLAKFGIKSMVHLEKIGTYFAKLYPELQSIFENVQYIKKELSTSKYYIEQRVALEKWQKEESKKQIMKPLFGFFAKKERKYQFAEELRIYNDTIWPAIKKLKELALEEVVGLEEVKRKLKKKSKQLESLIEELREIIGEVGTLA